ncbi:MAG: flagellar hook-basal body complex protein FliE [Verrucomicrobia bacterium]|nr:flagellar hook-basal body complex protein FliE [Verrucomicrobiota bacterium]
MADITKIGQHLPPLDPSRLGQIEQPKEGSFQNVLGGFLEKVNDLQLNMDETIKQFAAGEITDVHKVMIAAEEADVAFQLMMKIRGKLLKAYDEVMKMQV